MAATSFNKSNYTIDSFIGQNPYDVLIEPSEKLSELLAEAEKAQDLPFEEKLQVIQNLAVNAMQNAWECASKPGDKQRAGQSMVFQRHSLSEALKENLGCCRYQATLFLILGAQAKLGTKHFLQSTNLGQMNTCYNDVYDENNILHRISIFQLSLSDPKNTYVRDPEVFNRPNTCLSGYSFLGYAIDKEGNCTRYSRPKVHLEGDPERYQQAKEQKEYFESLMQTISASLAANPSEEDTKKLHQQSVRCTQMINDQNALMETYAPLDI